MNLELLVWILQLMIAHLIIILMLEAAAHAESRFDLNAMPGEDEFDETSGQVIVALSSPKKKVTTTNRRTFVNSKQKQDQKMSPAFYGKVLKLLEVLKLCDTKSFDIKRIKIPENFSSEIKAMMALNEIGKRNLIKKNDIDRYRRTMKNCSQLAEAVQEKLEETISVDSQTSGGTYEDRMRRLSESPIEGIRSRFIDKSDTKDTNNEKIELRPMMGSSKCSKVEDQTVCEPVARLDEASTGESKISPVSRARFIKFF